MMASGGACTVAKSGASRSLEPKNAADLFSSRPTVGLLHLPEGIGSLGWPRVPFSLTRLLQLLR